MLSQTINDNEILVDVQKNKGAMVSAVYPINTYTGVFSSPKHATSTNVPQLETKKDQWNGF